jgi:hypothetical protein
MKAKVTRILFGCGILACVSQSFAQSYSIDWFTVDGGGGTSTGGMYVVSGTAGQADGGTMSGGGYSLVGGFWGIISAVQTQGAPLLKIYLAGGNSAVISWPSPSMGFALQQNANLSTANWLPASEAVLDDGTNKFIIVSPPTGSRFYRLSKP